MIEFIKKALFGKTLSAIAEEQNRLSILEANLIRKRVENDGISKKLNEYKIELKERHDSLNNYKTSVDELKKDFDKQLHKFKLKQLEFDLDCETFQKYEQVSAERIKTQFEELKEIDEELQELKSNYENKLIDLQDKENRLEEKKQQIHDIKVINKEVKLVRGKEIIIDKYGNYKGKL